MEQALMERLGLTFVCATFSQPPTSHAAPPVAPSAAPIRDHLKMTWRPKMSLTIIQMTTFESSANLPTYYSIFLILKDFILHFIILL
ncbi:hypothetical protein Scep_012424 [Stephania cephalantha]|uniref:Uncharacterized protein n=1 Tax=Stephania cephalantha TaxID=152367 RepID=A0AAP0P9U5_9MAGN